MPQTCGESAGAVYLQLRVLWTGRGAPGMLAAQDLVEVCQGTREVAAVAPARLSLLGELGLVDERGGQKQVADPVAAVVRLCFTGAGMALQMRRPTPEELAAAWGTRPEEDTGEDCSCWGDPAAGHCSVCGDPLCTDCLDRTAGVCDECYAGD